MGLGEEEEDEDEERELEEPEAEELEPLDDPELEPELLLELELLLPLEALRRERFFSRPRPFSAPSLTEVDFSFPRCLLLSSSFLLVGEGALLEQKLGLERSISDVNTTRQVYTSHF